MKILVILIVLLLLAVIWDYSKGKIPNKLIFLGYCCGTIKLLLYEGSLMFIPGILFPVIILFPLYKIGTMGAGDIKLFSILGFYFPFTEVVFCIFMAFLLGAFISLFSMVRFDNFSERMTYLFSYLKECFCQKSFRYYYLDSKGKILTDMEKDKSRIHFAIPIFLSVLLHVGGVF